MNPAERQSLHERLSCGMDGELGRDELRFLWRRLDHDAGLREVWTHYHAIGASLRREPAIAASPGFAERVLASIEHEASLPVARRQPHRWLRWSAGGAIAASVAVAALMLSQPTGDSGSMPAAAGEMVAAAPAAAPAGEHASAPANVPPWLSGNAAGLLSQQASATLGAPFAAQASSAFGRRGYGEAATLRHYRTLDRRDGSYLLLLDPQSPPPARNREVRPGLQ